MDETEHETHFRTCPLCEACCGLEVTTKGDQVVRIRGDRSDPYSRGFICPKGSTLKQLHEDPDRLRQPVIRDGQEWRSVSWDEAFAEIERRLTPIIERHGNAASGVILGNPSVHNLGGQLYLGNLLRALRTKNIFSASTVDQMPKHVSAGLMWGNPDWFPIVDLERSDYLLMLGANPYVSNGSLTTIAGFPDRLEEMQARGGRVVVVDPRRTKTADHADEHIRIQPGSDPWWLLALIHVLIDEGLVALGRLAPHVAGLAEVEAAVADVTPESVETRCGIDAATTRRIARELAAAPSAAVYGRIGTHTAEFGTIASWAADVLNALTGNLDRAGGVMFNCSPGERIGERTPGGRGFELGRWTGRASGFGEVKGELPAATLAQELETPGEGQPKAVFVVACNPARSFPNSERIEQALANLELLVAVDPYITATTRHAHVILPPRSALERSHYDLVFEGAMTRAFAKYSPPVFATDELDEPEILSRLALVAGGAGAGADPLVIHQQMVDVRVDRAISDENHALYGRDGDEIRAALAEWDWAEQLVDFRIRTGRFGDGFGAQPDGLTLRRLIDEHPHGADLGPLVERFPDAIKTKSGHIELAPPPILDDLERLRASTEPPTDQVTLIGRRDLRSCNTWMHNVNVLIKGKERCTLHVHPVDAPALDLTEGQMASITSRVGSVVAPVEITDVVMPGVVSLPFGWGYDEDGIKMHTARTRPGVNSNRLTDDAVFDQLSGNAVLNAIPVHVEPAQA